MSSFAAACLAAVMPLLASPDPVALGWPASVLSTIGWKWFTLFLGACVVKFVASWTNRRVGPTEVVDKKPRRQWEKPANAAGSIGDTPALPSWANRDVPIIQDSILCCSDDEEDDADDAEAFTLTDMGKWLASKGEPVVSLPSAPVDAAGKCVPVDEPEGDVSELLNKTFTMGSSSDDHSGDAANRVHEEHTMGKKESSHSHHVSLPLPEREALNFSVHSAPGNVAGMMVPTKRRMSTPRRNLNRRILAAGSRTVTPTRTSQLRAAHCKARAARDTPAKRFNLSFCHSSISLR